MNFFKLFIGDYMRDTGTLTVAEHGAFMLMLMHHYATEKPLPQGRELHRLLRAETKTERESIDAVAAKFWRSTPDGLVNDRAAVEMAKANHQREVNRVVGKMGGRPKRTETESVSKSVSESVSESEPNRNPNHSHSQTPEEIQHPPTPRKRGRVSEFPPGFDRFWEAYPRKQAKAQAAKAFARLRADERLLEAMLAAVARQSRSEQWQRDGGQFIPMAATWLNGRRWEDGELQPAAEAPRETTEEYLARQRREREAEAARKTAPPAAVREKIAEITGRLRV